MFLRLLSSFQLVTSWVFFTGQLKAFRRSSDPTIHQNNAFLCTVIFDYGFWQGPNDSDKGSLCVDTRLRARSCIFGIQRTHNGSVYLSEKNTPAVIQANYFVAGRNTTTDKTRVRLLEPTRSTALRRWLRHGWPRRDMRRRIAKVQI